MRARWAVCTLVAALLAAGCGATQGKPEVSLETTASHTFEDQRRGFSVSLPDGWHRARRNLTPQLVEPREMLSVATYPLRYRRGARCRIAGCPTPALNGFRATDILVSIQERVGARPAAEEVSIGLRKQEVGPGGCTRGLVRWYAFESFAAAGRSLYTFVVVGERASASVRRELGRILDSLRFARQQSRFGHRHGAQSGTVPQVSPRGSA